MQKLLVMLMSVTLLIISSVPMSASAASCAIPVHPSVANDINANHEYGMSLNSDWQYDRIECGCGCHNSIDSLPQLFAPHMTSDIIQLTEPASVPVSVQTEMAWQASAVRVPLPPPQYLIFS